jgi:hypothetical protein
MGRMRFRVFPPVRITDELIEQAYLLGIDRASWPTRVHREGDELVFDRAVPDSVNLHMPWTVEGHGLLALSTGSLIERPAPYLVPLELARGTTVEVRNQLSEWQLIGLSVPEGVTQKLAEAVERLSWAVVGQEDVAAAAGHAEESLRAALDAGNLLAAAYTEQALAARRRNGGRAPGLLAGELGVELLDGHASRQFVQTFNTAIVPVQWRETETTEGHFSWATSDRQIEWCRSAGLKVLAGPLLPFDRVALPDWLSLFEDDFDSVLQFASAFARAAVAHYREKVDGWIAAGRINAAEELALTEQERLRLVARIVDLVRSLDPDAPVLASFDQPWGENLRQRGSDLPSLHFADALVRAGLGLDGLMIEMNVGYWPGGTLPRHPVEFSRQLDAWNMLGLPLWLSLCAPSAEGDDPLAQRKTKVVPAGATGLGSGTPAPVGWSPAAQRAFAARFVPLALAKPGVQGVVWNQVCDSQPHRFPHAGLFDPSGRPKPALATLAAMRQNHLK